MYRRPWILLLSGALAFSASAQVVMPQTGEQTPLTNASVPLTYVGTNGRVSIGIDSDGNTQGDVMGVFGNNGERAFIGQLWWANGGSGGIQVDYNWLWGMSLDQARTRPDAATVAKLTFAVDQNQARNRRATVGVGMERQEFYLDAYLSAAIGTTQNAGSQTSIVQTTLSGSDANGAYTQNQTITTVTELGQQAYDHGVGFRVGHFSNDWALRSYAGFDYQNGQQGAHQATFSAGADKYIGHRGWSVSGLVEHSDASDPVSGHHSDNRATLLLRYDFAGRAAFAPTDQATSPTWIPRALSNPSAAHPRTVSTYTRRTTTTTTTHLGPRQYVNQPPLAVNVAATVAENSSNNPINVLAGDSDPDGDTVTLTAVSAPMHGTAVVAGNQASYTPAPGYFGTDSFGYTISDGHGASASAVVMVTVTQASNQSPVARDIAVTTPYATPVTVNPLANAGDPDGDRLSVSAIGQPTHGTATLNGDGTVTYVPQTHFVGSDSFPYTVSDGRGGTASATVTVRVLNLVPVARNDSATTPYATPVTIDVLANDSDADGDTLTVIRVSNPAHGTATINSSNTVTYSPQANFFGTDSFVYVISDGHGGSAVATVTVTVLNAPPIANPFATKVIPGQQIQFNVLATASDADGDALTLISVSAPQYGTVTYQPNGTVIYTANMISGNPVNDTFSYTISDGHGNTTNSTITVTIEP